MKRPLIISALFLLLSAAGRADVILIGKYDAKVVPEQVATLSFQSKGIVSDLLRCNEQRVEKDTVIAVMDKDKTAEEREDMELAIQRERLNKKDEIRKLELQREKLTFYLSLSESERAYAKDYKPDNNEDATQEALIDIDERISLNRRELDTAERRKRLEFDTKHELLTLRMPFTGRLQYHFPMPDESATTFEYTPNTAQPFATVCDDSAFYITIRVSDTNLTLLPGESFSVSVKLPGGKQLSGTYAFRRVERAGANSDMLVYFFKIPLEDHPTAYKMLGSNVEATLMYSSGTGSKRVRKIDLLTHPAAADCEDWQQLVSIVYPDYDLFLVADRDLIIRPKSDTSDSAP